jgi:hypothetical protein
MINQPQVRRLVIGLQSVVKMPILTRSTGYKLVVFPAMSVVRSLSLSAFSLAAICMIVHLPTQAGLLSDEDIKRRADAVVGLMSFTLTPDVTTGSLSLSNEPTGNPDLALTTLGGGFTMSRDFPLYLEGTAGYSRYDPAFVFSDGAVQRPVPVKWNSLALTGGVGWDFPVAEELTFRPIFNFSYGRIKSDSAIAGDLLEDRTGADLEFLNNGTLEVFGLGGTLMLDYERYRDENEIDVELRYSNIRLQSFSDAPEAVQGSSNAQSLSLWTRWRAPTSLTALNRPVRYVLEAAHTSYIGDMRGALGFDALNSLGVGLELDSSDHDIIVTRARVVFRYKFGDNVEGTSVGLAVSF